MKRCLVLLMLLVAPAVAPAPAAATPQFDVIAALQNLRAGRAGDALALLNQAVAARGLKPGELADALEWRAYIHETRKNARAALVDLDAAAAAEPENPLRRRARGRLLMRVGQHQRAAADFEFAIGRGPPDAESYTDYCEALLRSGRRAQAVEQCRKAVQTNPEYARAKTMLRRAQGR